MPCNCTCLERPIVAAHLSLAILGSARGEVEGPGTAARAFPRPCPLVRPLQANSQRDNPKVSWLFEEAHNVGQSPAVGGVPVDGERVAEAVPLQQMVGDGPTVDQGEDELAVVDGALAVA